MLGFLLSASSAEAVQPRCRYSLRFTTEAAARSARTSILGAVPVGATVTIATTTYFDAEIGLWLAWGELQVASASVRDTFATATATLMKGAGPRTGSYVVSWLSHLDEGFGGQPDVDTMTRTIK